MSIMLKKIPTHIKQNKVKTGIIFGLSAYWGILLAGTFITFN